MKHERDARRPAAGPGFGSSLRTQGLFALALPLAVLLFSAMFSVYWIEAEVTAADQSVHRTVELRSQVQGLLTLLLNAQTGMRGFVATGQERFLEPYRQATALLGGALSRLAGSVKDDPDQAQRMAEIGRVARQELDLLNRLGESGRASNPVRVGLLESDKAAMDRLRGLLGATLEAEDRQLARAQLRRDVGRARLVRTVIGCAVIGPLGALGMFLILAGRLVRRIQLVGDNARRLAHGLPLETLPPGSDEVAMLAAEIEEAAVQLRAREREMRESGQRFRDLFDQAPVPYEETDREGQVRRVNRAECRLLDREPERIVGRPAWELVAPDHQEAARRELLERIAAGTETEPFQCDYLLENGSRLTVEIHESLIRDGLGEVTGARRSLLDVTERNLALMAATKVEQYAQELRRKNEQLVRALAGAKSATETKSRFLAGMSHELRTPLNGIIGFAELMHDGKVGPVSEQHREYLGDILTGARHLLQLINDILDLSKVEAGKMEFRPERCDVGSLVREVRDVIRPLAEQRQIEVRTEAPENFFAVLDPSRFKQVVYNYLSNAVKFTDARGQVSARIAPEGAASFRVDVEDNGIGIEPAEIDTLFNDFRQLPNGRKTGHGTGLGLALTRRIVEAQGGSVAVRSTPGQGSVFSAIIPLWPVSGPVEPGASAVPRPGCTIVVVEDDAATLKIVRTALESLGHKAFCFSDGQSALAALAGIRPDAVLLDLVLPGVDGSAFLDRLRADPAFASLPVILWTNKDLSAGERARLRGMAQSVLSKQECTPRALLSEITRVIGYSPGAISPITQ